MIKLATLATHYAKFWFASAGITSTGIVAGSHQPVWVTILVGAIYAGSVWAAENKPKQPPA